MQPTINHDPFANSDETRSVKKLEADLLALSKDDQQLLQEIDVFVQKLNVKAAPTSAKPISTGSSACTSACFSSASTVCAENTVEMSKRDPESARALAVLYKRGIEAVGEARFMDQIIERAKENEPVKLIQEAMKGQR
jgi:hypothetical protein